MVNLDEVDKRLLAELQAEGRVTNVDLASRVGLTPPPCLRRVRSLEESGVIKGYHADLDASRLGFAITVFALVSLKSQAEEALRQFEDHVRTLPEVRECHMLNGEIDFILKRGAETVPVECKAVLGINRRHMKGVLKYLEAYSLKTGFIVSFAPYAEMKTSDARTVTNLPAYLLEAFTALAGFPNESSTEETAS